MKGKIGHSDHETIELQVWHKFTDARKFTG